MEGKMNYRRILTRKLAMVVLVAVVASLVIALVAIPAGAFTWIPQLGGGAVLNSPDPSVIPTMINYQGYLTDSSGTPLNGSLSMIFAIYDAASGGTQLWTETQPSVPVTNGLFNVLLGSVNPINASHLNGESYLGIQVGADLEVTPRQRLASVPYAMRADKANDADTLDGMDSTNFVNKSGDTMTGALTVDGIIESTSGGFKFPDGTTQTTSSQPSEPQWPSIQIGTIEFTIDGEPQAPVALYGLTQHIVSEVAWSDWGVVFPSVPRFDKFSIIIKQGPLMPILQMALCENQLVESIIELRRPGITGEEHYMTITLGGAGGIASIETMEESGKSDPKMQEISFPVGDPDYSPVSWIWEEDQTIVVWDFGAAPGEESVEYWTAGEGPGLPPLEGKSLFASSFRQKFSAPRDPVTGMLIGKILNEGCVVSRNVDKNTIVNSIPAVCGQAPMSEFLLAAWEYNPVSSSWEKKQYYILGDDVYTYELEISSNKGVLVEKAKYIGENVTWVNEDGMTEYLWHY
jgi:hypothetical protein